MPYYIKRKKTELSKTEKTGKKSRTPPSLSTLRDRLDTVFSKYIRLRDAMPSGNGVFRCISCGQIKPLEQADCGHFHSRTHMATRFDEDNCHAECRYCLTPDHKVLMADLTWKPLGLVNVGEKLFAFDEERTHGNFRRYKVATVLSVENDVQDVYEVELENGDRIKTTANHKWLAREGRGTTYKWVETQDLWINGRNLEGKHKTGPHTANVTSTVCKLFEVVEQVHSYESGWVAGMLDADGHICQQVIHDKDGSTRYGFRVGIAQSEKYINICDKIKKLLEAFTDNNKTCRQVMEKGTGYVGKHKTWQFLITGSNVEKLQFLMRTRPMKIEKVDIEKLGKLKSQYDTKVKRITYLGKRRIVVMETSTHTFIAEGYAMHNCNRFCADHLIGYRANLIRKIGEQRFSLLEVKARSTKKWSAFELEQLIKYYRALVQKLERDKGLKL